MDECFVIMPISTPEHLVDTYGDPDHFQDVYQDLFKPAIEQAELTPVPPVAKGSVLIHADIIERIAKAPLVLCDMSILNPNVFFELGIRTALNKPVCMVKDSNTPEVPFDNNMINHYTYRCKLTAKELRVEIPKLAEHIKDSKETSNGGNFIWKYFGITAFGKAPEGSEGVDAKMDYLIKLAEAQRQSENKAFHATVSGPPTFSDAKLMLERLETLAKELGINLGAWTFDLDKRIIIIHDWEGDLVLETKLKLAVVAKMKGWKLEFYPEDVG